MNHPQIIYRLLAAEAWQQAQLAGSFVGSEHDVRDGFIHFSTATQVAETAARHYAGQAGLLLLSVSAPALGDALRWEPSRGGALFPHLYGALPLSAVTRVDELTLSGGKHVFPTDLT
ncbi:MAG TPA: DUF952 domain-containing protein [Polyangiaceae bacterium]|nr:DUF952 domain-containing protein [Polyangiaceae bacterium]